MKKQPRNKRVLPTGQDVVISKEDMKHLNSSLGWGNRGELANVLGVSKSTLTNLFKPKRIYKIETKTFVNEYRMPKSILDKINQFILIIK